MTPRNSPKTPYEIRLELLQLAQTILRDKNAAISISDGRGKVTAATSEEIIAEAEKMNAFISKASNTQ